MVGLPSNHAIRKFGQVSCQAALWTAAAASGVWGGPAGLTAAIALAGLDLRTGPPRAPSGFDIVIQIAIGLSFALCGVLAYRFRPGTGYTPNWYPPHHRPGMGYVDSRSAKVLIEHGLAEAGRWRVPLILRLRPDLQVDDIRSVLTAVTNASTKSSYSSPRTRSCRQPI